MTQEIKHHTQTSYSPNSTYARTSRSTPPNKHFNNNLSELDTLLQDLSNAEYNNQSFVNNSDRNVKVSSVVTSNGSTSPGYGTTQPGKMLNDTFKRPSVDSLLEELNTAVPNG